MSDKRKRKQDKRDKKKAKGGGGAPRPRDPQAELEQHLDRFMELALEHEALDEFGLDPEAFLPAALGRGGGVSVVPPGGDLADVVVPRLASAEAAAALREALAGAQEVFQAERRPQRDMLALFAAIAVAEDAVQEGAEEDHPLWALAFDTTFARALGGGGLVAAALDDPARRPSVDAIAAALTRALEDEALRQSLGPSPPAPAELAAWLLETLDDPELLPALPPEVVLHGLHATHRVAMDLGQRLGKEGPTPAIVRDLEAAAAAAYALDPVGEVAPEIARDVALALAAEGSGEERAPLQAMLVALRAWSPAESPLLRRAWGASIAAPAVAEEEEEELAGAVWADPDDAAALGALEAHLKAAAPARAARVARFRAAPKAAP